MKRFSRSSLSSRHAPLLELLLLCLLSGGLILRVSGKPWLPFGHTVSALRWLTDPVERERIANQTRIAQEEEERQRLAYENAQKYFHEPASHEPGADDTLGHYDTRFFSGKPLSYADKRVTQVHMVRAYLDLFRQRGIETWLAHGTLLGWWWNEQLLPWDWDIDTQVSEATLFWLGDEMNNTRHEYTARIPISYGAKSSRTTNDTEGELGASQNQLDDQEETVELTRTYLLDINPNVINRTNGDGFNIIDARWINVHNGLYIDITGLSELEPEDAPGVISCKNFHEYRIRDIYPLRETMFEGVLARVPYSYSSILAEEYDSAALVKTAFEGHHWDRRVGQWIRTSVNATGGNENNDKG